MALKKDIKPNPNFNQITITLASPDDILDRSYGEVLKPETINYRTYKPERDGLFCEKIFGPMKDFECYCGKYKRIRYKGIVCDRCGVEVTEKKVRRERMGHIRLVVPVVHIWYFRSLPNKIGYLLGTSSKKLESIVYYEKYCVVQGGAADEMIRGVQQIKEDAPTYMELISEDDYLDILEKLPKENQMLPDDDPNKFIAKMGADAVHMLLGRLDLDKLSYDLRHAAEFETSQQRKTDALKRLTVVEGFRDANSHIENRPEWMIMQYLPVIPPELRPLVPLDGGRFASSDLNDLYRRVIIRNNRLKRLMEIKAPDVILRNEKRMLQEAVDSLMDNSRKSNAVKAEGGRQLKSLSDVLKGKQGRFRQNLLGKRVDYSGRSVIVVGPTLKLHECGLPKDMCAELFKPFVIRKLIERGIVKTVKSAKKLVERKDAVIWDILENILKGHPVLLNRAPTLHRLSIQAFQPKLIEGKAIQLHPLVCSSFNADFDGDQMAVHVPLSNAAILEAQVLMLASHNILNPQNGTPITLPSQDMVLGLYYMTKKKMNIKGDPVKGEDMTFYSPEEVGIAYNEKLVDLHAQVKVRIQKKDEEGNIISSYIQQSTVGRIMFNQHVPKTVGFIDALLTKKALRTIIGDIIKQTDVPTTVEFLDNIKGLGFRMAFEGGLSFNPEDLIIPDAKQNMIEGASDEVDEIWDNYNMGLITNNERYNQIIDVWSRVDTKVTETLIQEMATDKQGFNSVYMMLDSGARGSKQQVKQLSGIRGLMAKPRKSGSTGSEIIENPILSNFKDGLNVLEYFISTHGARKGLADTALKTADAGYLTRRLVDVAQDVVVNEEDCGTLRGIKTKALKENDEIVESLSERIIGRNSLQDVIDFQTDEVLLEAGVEITEDHAAAIEAAGVEEIEIRSVLTCESKRGTCSQCYGKNLAVGRSAQRGDAVGIIAAQSIGEPGTQLTLRTFHVGGVAGSAAVDSSLPSKFDGKIEFDGIKTVKRTTKDGDTEEIVISRMGEIRIINADERVLSNADIPYGSILKVRHGQKLKKGDEICSWDPFNAVIVSEVEGSVRFDNIVDGVTFREESDEQSGVKEKVIIETKDKKLIPAMIIEGKKDKNYNIPVGAHLSIKDGDKITAGQTLVKIPRVMGRSRDITGGLPRVTELFEARNPSNPAVVAAIDGVVSFGGIKRGNREIQVESKDGVVKKYLVNLSKHIIVQEGDFVKAGMAMSDGRITPRDILAIKGPFAVQSYLVNEIQEVYRLQGVKINDKHIEVIVRQMMRKVTIENPGDTRFLMRETVDKIRFAEENDWVYDKVVVTDKGDSEKLHSGQIVTLREIREENSLMKRSDKTLIQYRDAEPATSSPLLLGITKASLGTRSWISAASFQETTKVLSTAAINGKRDSLEGLKENVITGRRIPAGTGMKEFQDYIVGSKDEYEILKNAQELLEFDEEE